MYARVKLFIIYLYTFEIPDFVRFQRPENRFLFSQPVQPLTNIQEMMGLESSGVVGFDLGPLLQGQTRIEKVKTAYKSLIIAPRGLGW